MALTKQQFRRGGDYNNLEITGVKSITTNQDASAPGQLVRKSQAEAIAQSAAEGNLVATIASANTTTAFTSQAMVDLLNTKQNNLSIHPDSVAFLEINNNQVSVKSLLQRNVVTDSSSPSLDAWLTNNPSHTLEEGDTLVLLTAIINQERTWVHNGGNTGTASDFTKLVTDYNEFVIRSMISSGDSFITYDNITGKFSINFGTSTTSLGAQTIPVDNAEFSTVTGDNVLLVLKALESYIVQVDTNATGGASTLDTRLTSLSGVSGNNLGTFSGPVFPDGATVKQVLEASSTEHINAGVDRAAIRSQYATADQIIQNNLDAEIARATAAEDAEAVTRATSDSNLQNAINANSSIIISESQTRAQADGLIHQRLDILEGDNQTTGSVSNAVATSNSFTMQQIAIESAARQAADAALDLKIDNLAEGDITFVGTIQANTSVSIRQDRIDAGDTRNGQFITNIDLKAGETFVIGADTDIGLSDATNGIVAYEKGDKLMITQDVTAGNLLEAHINAVPANQTGLAVQNVTGSSTIELDINSELEVKQDSISRDHLVASIEADIDDKMSKTSNNTMSMSTNVHSYTDTNTGDAQNLFLKRISNTSDALTGTKRALLGELWVSSAGSGDANNPNYAHTATLSTKYNGTSTNLSMAIGGVNSEATVTNSAAAVYATGSYGIAISNQAGINAGITGIAQNAGLSNIGVTGFSEAGGAGNDRGGVFVISDNTFESYTTHRANNPIGFPDAALIADAETSASSKAFVALGDSVFQGEVIIPSATTDNHAVNLGDIKSKEEAQVKTVPAGGSVTVNHSLNTKKILVSLWYEDELITSTVDIDERTNTSFKIHNGSATPLEDVDVYIIGLS